MANDSDLKSVVSLVGAVASLVSDLSRGLALSEIAEAEAVASQVKAVVASAPVLLPEWESLDDAARSDLVAAVSASVKVPASAKVEEVAQKVLKVAVEVSALYQLIKA